MGDSLLGSEGPPGDPSCADGCDNDEDGAIDGADSECQAVDPCVPNPCDDGNECTDNVCTNVDGTAQCTHPPLSAGTSCGDPTNTDCDLADTCDGAGVCDSNIVADGVACGDPTSTECDNPDTCVGGTCMMNVVSDGTACGDSSSSACDAADSCLDGTCDTNTAADGTTCDDGDVCTANDACMTGACMGNSLLGSEGPSGDPSCADGCDNDEDGAVDEADSDCQVVDPCVPNPCDDGNECTDNVCTNVDGNAECTHPPLAAGTACGDATNTDCNLADTCDGAGVCDPNLAADGTTCDDGDVCTANDACTTGACMGDSLRGSEGPSGDPSCADGCDNDEDGAIDGADSGCQAVDLCADFTPVTTTCGTGECAATGMTTCDPATGEIGDSCAPGTPSDEICNDLDDDCDGEVDEDFADKGMACTVGEGVCEAMGVYVCKTDCAGLECDAVPGEPGVEGPVDDPTCSDGMDNDCDGHTDLDDADCLDECDIVRAEVEAACPADASWRNHGKYVSCASKRVSRAVCDGRIDVKCAGEIIRDFARSDVGKKDKDDKSKDDKSDDKSDDDGDNGDYGDDDPSSNDDNGKSDHNNSNKNKDKAKAKSYDDDYCPADDIGDDDDHIVVADRIHVVGAETNGGLVVLTDSPAFGSVHIVQPGETGYPGDLDLPEHAIVLEYTIENITPGATAQVTIDFPSGVTEPAVYKIVDGELRELDAELGSDNTLTFTVTDGGWLDEDNTANGRIVDPLVIGQAASVGTQAAAASSGGGGGGCALGMGATPVDMLSLAAPLLFLLRLKRRRR
jgi:hypothetical protein